ncbi:YdeI family protein [Chitinophaga sp. CB10]|uniref:YdeI/OmpD-associated family protein n=1 Tax=Chitinophaga sp. CB10 TaxID=1891659 RepID=UPI000AE96802|nr:YdeI family protein [Chitinophaga sp. CB10]
MNPKVDAFIDRADKWQKEFETLRSIMLDCPLEEELKWGVPCYAYHGKNVVLIHGFKDYCAILFHKGSLMADPEGVLIQQTENVQAARQMRFTSLKEIVKLKAVIKAYVYEAIEIEKAGLEVKFKKATEYPVPEEFQQELDTRPGLKKAFEALTPGRQRGYLLYFAAAKQAKTRAARVEKYLDHILAGKGLDD